MAFKVITASIVLSIVSHSMSWDCATEVDLPAPMKNFDLNMFLGKWYEYKYYLRMYDTNGDCASIEYTMSKDSGSIHMKTVELDWGDEVVDIAKLDQFNPDDKLGNFTLTYFMKSFVRGFHKIKRSKELFKYRVLGTDYKCWAITYLCDGGSFSPAGRTTVLLRDTDKNVCVKSQQEQDINNILQNIDTTVYGKLSLDKSFGLSENHHTRCWEKKT